ASEPVEAEGIERPRAFVVEGAQGRSVALEDPALQLRAGERGGETFHREDPSPFHVRNTRRSFARGVVFLKARSGQAFSGPRRARRRSGASRSPGSPPGSPSCRRRGRAG